jgi:uncharacterized membrane protein (DUF485 family)
MWLEALAGMVGGLLADYFGKHSLSAKGVFLTSLFTFMALCYLVSVFSGTRLIESIQWSLPIGLAFAAFTTVLHSLYRWYVQKNEENNSN